MPDEVEDTVQAILDDPDATDDESEAYAIAYDQHDGDTQKRAALAKAAPNASISKMGFEVTTEGSVGVLSKADDDFVIWGPASVEVVDKENDRIKAEALEKALPQLLKRSRLSYEHSDQIVGDILERFETDEPVEVEVAGHTFERSEFPTDVLELDGLEPGLYVAGNIYGDTQKAQDVREQVEKGEIDSYSISGEAIVTEMAQKDGQTFTDILELDLSAVTLCKEGMNQKAKFDVVSKTETSLDPQRAATIAKRQITQHMGDNDSDPTVEKFVDALDDTLDERLPDGEIATKSDVEHMVEEAVDEKLKAQEGSPTEGTPERPSGDSDSPTETDPEYEGDSDEWGDDPTTDSDKVEETKSDAYTTDELKSLLPDDQFKAIAPHLKADDEPDVDPRDERPEEEVDDRPSPDPEPEPEPDPVLDDEDDEEPVLAAEKSVEDLDWNRLTDQQKRALAKANLQKADGAVRASPGVAGGAQPAHAGSQQAQEVVAKADNESVTRDAALRKVYDDDGTPQI